MPFFDDDTWNRWPDSLDSSDEIPVEISRCDWCGRSRAGCSCDDSLFDADELGLDPEDDDGR